jgi:hypothetical protein
MLWYIIDLTYTSGLVYLCNGFGIYSNSFIFKTMNAVSQWFTKLKTVIPDTTNTYLKKKLFVPRNPSG